MIWIFSLSLLIFINPTFLLHIQSENQTIIATLHPHVTVTTGQKAVLTCIFDPTSQDFSAYQLIWIRQNHASYDADLILAHNQDLLISDPRLIVQRTAIDYSLTISDVTIDDEGSYTCEINTQPPQRAVGYLHVQEIPMIIDNATSSPLVINEYENVTMECQARGRPVPYIAWFRRNPNETNQTSLENQILANDTNGQLYLVNVSRHQTGHYECRASNGVNGHVVSKDIQLRVLFPPSIRTQSKLVHGIIGKSAQLRCSATVPFDTKIYWQRMDNHTMSKFRQQQQTHGDAIQTSLQIKEIEQNDFGLYGCFAESISGKSHAMIELREHRRSTNAPAVEKEDLSTSRIQILKRNKISDQTTISILANGASTSVPLFFFSMIFIQIIFYNLT